MTAPGQDRRTKRVFAKTAHLEAPEKTCPMTSSLSLLAALPLEFMLRIQAGATHIPPPREPFPDSCGRYTSSIGSYT